MELLFSLASTISATWYWRGCSDGACPRALTIVGLLTSRAAGTTWWAMIVLGLVHQLDDDIPLFLGEDANESLVGENGRAARGEVLTLI